jgi:hypothetical protein
MEDASARNDGMIPIAVAVNEFLMNFLRWLAIKFECEGLGFFLAKLNSRLHI